MNIIVGVDAFEECCAEALRRGKWDAWRLGYYPRFSGVFDAMLRYLYLAELDSLRGAVEAFDFERAARTARGFVDSGGVDLVRGLLQVSEQALRTDFDYEALLLVGVGHVSGTALPAERPFVYLGLENSGLLPSLRALVPHEFNHMVRSTRLRNTLDPNAFGERVMGEGLGVVCPLVVDAGTEAPSLAEALMMPLDAVKYCAAHWPDLLKEALPSWGAQLTPALMSEYFMGTDDGWCKGKPARAGYYIGTRMVLDLLDAGADFADLTCTPGNELLARWTDRGSGVNR